MRKFSLKPFLYSVFFLLTAAVLSACFYDPISYKDFTGDERVTAIVNRSVNIITAGDWPDYHSDDIFTQANEGDRRITGLDPDKYYIIEEYVTEPPPDGDSADDSQPPSPSDPDLILENVQYVQSNGTRSSRMTTIGKVSGGTITGLTNGNWYLVRAAEPLTGTVTIYDQAAVPVAPYTGGRQHTILDEDSENNNRGELNLSAPEKNFYMRFYPAVNGNGALSCVKFPVSPTPSSTAAIDAFPSSSGGIITLEGKNTETVYVFHKKDGKTILLPDDSNLFVDAFYIVKVAISDAPAPPELVITIDYVNTADQTFTFNPATYSPRTQAEAISGLTISIENTNTFNSIDGWYYGSTKLTSNATLNNTAIGSAVDFTVIGNYVFTFIGIKGTGTGAVPYSGTFTIVINQ